MEVNSFSKWLVLKRPYVAGFNRPLTQLKLPTILREHAAVAATTCTKDRSDYPTYLLRLTERELLDRERKAAERRIKEAGFPVVKTLDTCDFSALPAINEQLVRELARGEYIAGKRPGDRQQRHRQDPLGLCPGLCSLCPRKTGAFLHCYRPGDPVA